MIKVSQKLVQKCFGKRKKTSHKGQNGKVLVVGGSAEYSGAPALVGLAAKAVLRTGTDLVFVCAPEKTGWIVSEHLPDAIVYKQKGEYFSKKHARKVLEVSKKADCIVIGNGLGMRKETQEFAKEIAKKAKVPLVIDADAIKALKGFVFKNNAIITPHRKELEIFAGKKITRPEKQVTEIAKKHKCVVLLKGPTDYISDGKKVFYNATGNSGMTVGGTGDVLAGICAAIVSHKNLLLESACSAAFVNGLVGDRLLRKKGVGFIASDFAEEIPFVLKKFWKAKK